MAELHCSARRSVTKGSGDDRGTTDRVASWPAHTACNWRVVRRVRHPRQGVRREVSHRQAFTDLLEQHWHAAGGCIGRRAILADSLDELTANEVAQCRSDPLKGGVDRGMDVIAPDRLMGRPFRAKIEEIAGGARGPALEFGATAR